MQCMDWQGRRTKDGYGQMTFEGEIVYAHRHMWEVWHYEPIPLGGVIMHTCDNPPCINPHHLVLGSVGDNNRDMWAKGRGRNNSQRHTLCKRGHPLVEGNLYTRERNGNIEHECLTCVRMRNKKSWRIRDTVPWED